MVDIFLSYSHLDGAAAKRLADSLEALGCDVWWDERLSGGDNFNLEINNALLECNAAIVIWSDQSVQSQWVRAEAQYALDRGVLIPVRTTHLSLQIPPPFTNLHALDAHNVPEIFRACQKSIPQPRPQSLINLASSEIASTVGVVGLAVSLIASIQPFLVLATWARLVVDQWVNITAYIWYFTIYLFDLKLGFVFRNTLTGCLLIFLCGLGSEIRIENLRRHLHLATLQAWLTACSLVYGTRLTMLDQIERNKINYQVAKLNLQGIKQRLPRNLQRQVVQAYSDINAMSLQHTKDRKLFEAQELMRFTSNKWLKRAPFIIMVGVFVIPSILYVVELLPVALRQRTYEQGIELAWAYYTAFFGWIMFSGALKLTFQLFPEAVVWRRAVRAVLLFFALIFLNYVSILFEQHGIGA